MPLRITCLRHGESEANAGGEALTPPALIPLTDLGHRQATRLAQSLSEKPDKILCSPFLRARQTAAPTAKRFRLEPELVAIEEFTCLAPARCYGTTSLDRKPWVAAYWQKADPFFVDGEGAESFAAFMGRVDAIIATLEKTQPQTLFLFGHGFFFTALRWRLTALDHPLDPQMMKAVKQASHQEPIPNTSGFSFRL